ncbi:MAG: hypothetical protein HY979_01085 [Candidatus Magasanikbacteria bacterium]|nr:hypothetical protein [Candidatus Magasanikbacteria bacterium]
MFVLVAFVFSPLFLGVPFLPTHRKQARKMMDMAQIKPGMKMIDLGSGAGRLLFLAANMGAQATGYELNPFLFIWTKFVIFLTDKKDRVKVFYRSIYEADIADADVIFLFLYPPHMKKLEAKIFSEAKPDVKILSYVFQFHNYKPIANEQGIFMYKKMP